MKKLIIPAFVLALAAGAPAIAWSQDDHPDKDKHHAMAGQGDGAKSEDKDKHDDKTVKTPKTDTHSTSGPGGNAMGGAEKNTKTDEKSRTRDLNRSSTTQRDTKSDHDFDANFKAGDHDNNNNNNNNNNSRGDNDHRNDNNRDNHKSNDNNRTNIHINISTYRRTVTASHHFHAGNYRQPAHYSYRRWGLGERLPSDYYARDYWLSDFATYDLIAPPDGYVWVRFGPDALLIDEDDGEVIQVVYGVFI